MSAPSTEKPVSYVKENWSLVWRTLNHPFLVKARGREQYRSNIPDFSTAVSISNHFEFTIYVQPRFCVIIKIASGISPIMSRLAWHSLVTVGWSENVKNCLPCAAYKAFQWSFNLYKSDAWLSSTSGSILKRYKLPPEVCIWTHICFCLLL